MAHVELKAGAKLDLLSSEEHKKHIERVKNDFLDHMRQVEGETLTHSAGSFLLSAAGNTTGLYNGANGIYRVPVGYDAFLTRLSVDFEGSNAGSPTTCDLRVCADNNTPASLRSIINQVPNVFTESKSHAPLFRGGQLIVVSMTGGPANATIYCTVQVFLTQRKHTSADVLENQP